MCSLRRKTKRSSSSHGRVQACQQGRLTDQAKTFGLVAALRESDMHPGSGSRGASLGGAVDQRL